MKKYDVEDGGLQAHTLTKAQQRSVHSLWCHSTTPRPPYREFRRTVMPIIGYSEGAVAVPWAGGWIIVEADGASFAAGRIAPPCEPPCPDADLHSVFGCRTCGLEPLRD